MALHNRFVKWMNFKCNEIYIIRTHLGDMCFATLFLCVFKQFCRMVGSWLCHMIKLRVIKLLVCCLCWSIYFIKWIINVCFFSCYFCDIVIFSGGKNQDIFFIYRYNICVYHISILLYVDLGFYRDTSLMSVWTHEI